MKKILLPIKIILLQALFIVGVVNAERGIQVVIQSKETRTALIIGNSEYLTAPLKNPAHDAEDIAAVLGKRGFDVTLKLNAGKREMEEAIQKFGKKLGKGGVGLFYYAGHGMQVGGRNYLIPTSSKIETESDVKYEGVDAGRVLGKMEDAGNDLNIVILDACRNNPFARSFRSSEKGLARMDAPKGSLIAYATSPGATAADGDGRNGVYTKHLIKNIQKSDLTIEEILKLVRIAVIAETGNGQVPWESSSLVGNFFFNIQEVHIGQEAKVEKNGRAPIDAEEEFWLSIKESKRADDWRMYLTEYPDGKFGAIARLQLERLKNAESVKKEKISLLPGTWEVWQEGKGTNSTQLDKENNREWEYSISEINDDNFTCVSRYGDVSESVKGKQIRLSIHSRLGVPVRFNLYSFVPGYSKEDDDESVVPAGALLPIEVGQNNFLIDVGILQIPDWWLEERGNPQVAFNPRDIRWLDFCSDIYDASEPVADTLKFHVIDILGKE